METGSLRKHLATILSALLLAAHPYSALADRGEDLQNQLDSSHRKIQQTESQINEADSDRAEAVKQIAEIDRRIFGLANEIQSLRIELAQKSSEKEQAQGQLQSLALEIERAERELGDARDRLSKRKKAFSSRLKWMYMHGSVPYIGALLGSASVGDFLNRLSFLRFIADRDSELVRQIRAEEASIEQKRLSLERDKKAAEAKRAAAEAAERRIREIKAEQEKQLATLRADKAAKEALIERLQSDKVALLTVKQVEEANARVLQEQLSQWSASRAQRSPESSRGQERSSPGVGSPSASQPGWVWSPGVVDESVLAEVRRAIEEECARQGINPGPVIEIVMRESGGNPWAVNLQSGAAGLFQRVPGSLVTLGDIRGQVRDGVAYIRENYGTSEAALAFWDAHGWY